MISQGRHDDQPKPVLHAMPVDPAAWADRIEDSLDTGECFRAFDLAREARVLAPDDLRLVLLAALALMRCGAFADGRALVAEHERRLDLSEATIALAPLLVELHVQSWLRLDRRDDLARARDLQLAVHRAGGDQVALLSAAASTWHLGEQETARRLAKEGLRALPVGALAAIDDYRTGAAIGIGATIAGDHDQAQEALTAAVAAAGHRHQLVADTRAELLRLSSDGLAVPEATLAPLAPPILVVFTGQHLSGPEAAMLDLEQRLAQEIRDRLDELDASIGYASAAAGPDLLFIEAMLARGAEINVLLPFARPDFVALRVQSAGERWVGRFDHALLRATSVTQVSENPYLGDAIAFRYANQIMDGTARLRADMLGTEPHLIAAWHYLAMDAPGGAGDFIDHWGDPARLRIIDLDEVGGGALDGAPAEDRPLRPPVRDPQRVAAMMFADVVGFSRLADQDIALLWSFMAEVHASMAGHHPPVRLIDSWGDGLLVVMDTALGLADYASAITEAFAAGDPAAIGLPFRPELRVGLHVGPVLETDHPLTGRRMVYGGNVNRAARIEPISVPGQIYASQQFVALLTAEESTLRHEALQSGGSDPGRYEVEYVGIQHLPKDFGEQAIYVIRRAATERGRG